MGRVMRALGRFVSDWRNGATLLGTVLVALLVVVVIDGLSARNAALDAATATARQAKSAQQAATRRIDLLSRGQQQLVRHVALLAEENAALRQQVADMGGQPAQVSNSGAARAFPAPSPAPRATRSPAPRQTASPKPSRSPSPSPSPSPSCRRLPIIGCPGVRQ